MSFFYFFIFYMGACVFHKKSFKKIPMGEPGSIEAPK